MAAKKGCMICGKEKNGTEIEEGYFIAAIRWFKENVTHNAKGYRIVVCKECMPKYLKERAKFVRRRMMYVGLGVIFTITIAVVSQGKYLGIIAYGIGITIFLYLLSLVSYMPPLRSESKDGARPKSRR